MINPFPAPSFCNPSLQKGRDTELGIGRQAEVKHPSHLSPVQEYTLMGEHQVKNHIPLAFWEYDSHPRFLLLK